MIGYVTMGCRLDLRCPSMCSSSLVTSTCARVLSMANSYFLWCLSLLASLDLGAGSHRGMAHEKFSRKFSGTVVTVHCWHQLALEQHLPSPGPAFSSEWLWRTCWWPIEWTSHNACPVSPTQDCCRNFSFACGMEQWNEAASGHASVLTCSFLFRALARLQPPAGTIETAMGIEG